MIKTRHTDHNMKLQPWGYTSGLTVDLGQNSAVVEGRYITQ